MKPADIPQFGVLQSLRVLSAGSAIAGPLAMGLMAELGAQGIHVENVELPDSMRDSSWAFFAVEHRNQRNIALNINTDSGRDIFARLLRWADIWIEASKGGTMARWGLSDEDVWKINPKLVIVHVSGYGQSGVDEYVQRPGYDGTAQAYSGYMTWNGYADPSPPMRAKPFTADYMPAVYGAFVGLAAVLRARETGVGESIDLAQYEVLVRFQGNYLVDFLNYERMVPRTGNREASWSVYDTFRTADGANVLIMIVGRTMWARAIAFFGLEADPDMPGPDHGSVLPDSPAAMTMEARLTEYFANRTADEAVRELRTAKLTVSKVYGPEDMVADPHYRARETLTEWYDHVEDRMLNGPNIVPKFSRHPTQIWRSGPAFGEDSDDILAELGYSDAEREDIYNARVSWDPAKPRHLGQPATGNDAAAQTAVRPA
jgi:L-carnitine CoA-transferase